jgi:hypothetical protein
VSVPSNIERLLEGYKVPYSVTEMAGVSPQTKGGLVIELKTYNAAHAIVLINANDEKVIAIIRYSKNQCNLW